MEDKEMKEEKRLVEVSLSVAFVRCSHFKARVWQRGSQCCPPSPNPANNNSHKKTLMPNEMTTGDAVAFFFLLPSLSSCALPPVLPHPPPSKCGKLLTGVNGIIAQGNNQQMEYAKWRRDRRQRRRETDRDRSRRIFLLKSGSDVVPPN